MSIALDREESRGRTHLRQDFGVSGDVTQIQILIRMGSVALDD